MITKITIFNACQTRQNSMAYASIFQVLSHLSKTTVLTSSYFTARLNPIEDTQASDNQRN